MSNPIGLSNFIINECLLGTEFLDEPLPVEGASYYPDEYDAIPVPLPMHLRN